MADISWPAGLPAPSSFVLGLRSNTFAHLSPFGGVVQTVEIPGARWIANLRWNALPPHEAAILRSLLVRLRGRANRLLLWDFARPVPRGPATGTPVVSGGGQTGSSLVTSGWTANVSDILLAGDMIGVGGELKMVTANASSNASGVATLQIEPPLRASPPANSAIALQRPTARFVLTQDDVSWTNRGTFVTENIELALEESFA